MLHISADSTPQLLAQLYMQTNCSCLNEPALNRQQQKGRKTAMNQVHTGGEAVPTGVALQFLLAVLAVKVIFAGRAQVH